MFAVLRHVRLNIERRRMVGDVLCRALDPDDIGTQRVSLSVSVTLCSQRCCGACLFRLAVDEDRVVVLDEEPHGHTVRLPARPDGGEPADEVLAEPTLSVFTQPGGQMGREFCCAFTSVPPPLRCWAARSAGRFADFR